MSKPIEETLTPTPDALFGRVVSILEQARGNVVRAVNTHMVLAYWLIGREIVEAVQGGEERAEYGKKVIEDLSGRLTERYGKGFSVTNLWYFRQFYLAFADRLQILHPSGGESSGSAIPHPIGVESTEEGILSPAGRDLTLKTSVGWECSNISKNCAVSVGANLFARNSLSVRMNSHLQPNQLRLLG